MGKEKGLSGLNTDNNMRSSCLIFRQYNNYQFIFWKENIIFLDMLLRVLQSFLQIKLSTTIYWNIVESGIKHNKPKPNTKLIYNVN
jgi:hypothetical protein